MLSTNNERNHKIITSVKAWCTTKYINCQNVELYYWPKLKANSYFSTFNACFFFIVTFFLFLHLLSYLQYYNCLENVLPSVCFQSHLHEILLCFTIYFIILFYFSFGSLKLLFISVKYNFVKLLTLLNSIVINLKMTKFPSLKFFFNFILNQL